MNSTASLYPHNTLSEEPVPKRITNVIPFKFTEKNEKKLLKALLINRLHKLFIELFQNKIQCIEKNSPLECYTIDSKIIQLLIHAIVDTGEYTLEGIAYYTRIPFDIIFDAACGSSNQLSITPWSKVVDLYIQVKPEIARILFDRLHELKEEKSSILSLLLTDQ